MLKVTVGLNLYNTHSWGNIVYFNYSVFTQKLKSTLGVWFKLLSQVKDFSSHRQCVVISQKRCSMEMLWQQATNRKRYSYSAYLMAAIVMILNVIEGHSPIASLFKCDISYVCHVGHSLCICRACVECNVFFKNGLMDQERVRLVGSPESLPRYWLWRD